MRTAKIGPDLRLQNNVEQFLGHIVKSWGKIPFWDLREWNRSFEDVHEVYIRNCRQKLLYTHITFNTPVV